MCPVPGVLQWTSPCLSLDIGKLASYVWWVIIAANFIVNVYRINKLICLYVESSEANTCVCIYNITHLGKVKKFCCIYYWCCVQPCWLDVTCWTLMNSNRLSRNSKLRGFSFFFSRLDVELWPLLECSTHSPLSLSCLLIRFLHPPPPCLFCTAFQQLLFRGSGYSSPLLL